MNRINSILVLLIILYAFAYSSMAHASQKGELKLPRLSIQLWSVRDSLEKDFKGTIRQLAKMGFEGVEFAGNYGPFKNDALALRKFLTENNLEASGVHIDFSQLQADVVDKNLRFYQLLGIKYVIIPWDNRAWDPDGVESLVEELNSLVRKVEEYGMQLGFHNHDKEFNPYKDGTFWDFIAQKTSRKILLQLDIGWVRYAGKDPLEYIKKYPGRTLTTHYKIRTHKEDKLSPIIGDNGYDWKKLIQSNVAFGGTKWIVLEQEEYPEGVTPLQAVEKSKTRFRNNFLIRFY